MTIQILLADDHAIMREGLRYLLDAHSDLRVIGEAADGRQAVEQALPKFKIVARHQDQDGNLCSRARLEKNKVEEAVYAALHPKPGGG